MELRFDVIAVLSEHEPPPGTVHTCTVRVAPVQRDATTMTEHRFFDVKVRLMTQGTADAQAVVAHAVQAVRGLLDESAALRYLTKQAHPTPID